MGELLGDEVWDEALLSQISGEFLQVVWHYLIAAGSVDLEQFHHRIQKIVSPSIREQTMTLADQLRREGRLEGRLATLHDNIIEALLVRFGDVPDAVREAIAEIGEEEKLRELHRGAILTPSLDNFAEALRR